MNDARRPDHRTTDSVALTDWSSLFARIARDLARIVRLEIRLFQAALDPVLVGVVNRLLIYLTALGIFAAGTACVLVAFIAILHRWIGWPGAFALTGGMCFAAGTVSLLLAKRHSPGSSG